mgnify:CR=1 FL=1
MSPHKRRRAKEFTVTEGCILSKEIILKIKEAEAEAQKIRSDAAAEAAERIRRAELEGKKLQLLVNPSDDEITCKVCGKEFKIPALEAITIEI